MLTKTITSPQHPLIKHFVKLRTSKVYRIKEKHVLIVEKKLVSELAKNRPLKRLIVDKNFLIPKSFSVKEVVFAAPSLFKKVTGLANPELIAAEIPLPQEEDLSQKQYLLGLDEITDPGNLGTLFRTALALNWEGVFLIEKCTDPFNDKALRAAKGATFQLPFKTGSQEDFLTLLNKSSLHPYIADAKGKPLKSAHPTPPMALILGNEARGASPEIKKSGTLLSIPIHQKMESLNVAIAGAILMHAMRRP